MPTMTNPNPCIGSAVLDNATDGSALFRALGGHYTSPAQAVCEFIDDSLSSIAANGDEVGEVFLRVTDRGELVELSVTDSGSGIADLGAALTISDRSVAQTPYNEHGCGLKSALSHLCGGAEDWSIETRTADDAAADRYRCVSAPYAAVNAHMTERIYAGAATFPWVTGTIVRLRCPMPRFAQLKPASRRTPADFCQLVDYLAEELRYTYAPLLASGQLILSILRCEQNGHEQLLSLDALEPEWDGDAVELPETKLDLGGGPVTVRCRYGLIIKSKSNAVYYKGNMASSGFEIRLNGRAVAHGLLGAVYGKATHPSGNRFLARVDLLSGDGAALPPTETTKNAFVEADPRTQALYAFLRANVEPPKPPRPRAGKEPRRAARGEAARRAGCPARVARGPHLSLHRPQEPDRPARRPRRRRDDFRSEGRGYLCARSLSAALVLGRVCARRCAGARGRTDRLQAPARGHPAGAPDEQLVRSHRQAVPHHLADLAAGGDRRMRPYPVIDPAGDGGEHPPPPPRVGILRAGCAEISESGLPAGRVPLAERQGAAEP